MGVWFWTSIFVGPILAVLLLLAYFVAELIEVERKGHSIRSDLSRDLPSYPKGVNYINPIFRF